MSKFFLITYDLKVPGRDYSNLYEVIKSNYEWMHPLESTWVLKVNDEKTASQLYEEIRPCIDNNDSLFIVDITHQDRQGWLSKSFWEWLKK